MKSSPVNALQVECAEPPLKLRRQYLSGRFLFRAAQLNTHPLIPKLTHLSQLIQSKSYWVHKKPPSLVQSLVRLNNISAPLFQSDKLPIYHVSIEALSFKPQIYFSIGIKKDTTQANPKFNDIIQCRWPNWHQLYTDASEMEADGNVGCAFILTEPNYSLKHKLPPESTVFIGAKTALANIQRALLYLPDIGRIALAAVAIKKSVLCSALFYIINYSPLATSKGDGAPAENVTELTQNMIVLKDVERQHSSLYLRLEIDLVFVGLLLLALATRLQNLDEPRYIVFDELHYGRYVSLYTKGIFFFDAHPPLGKQLLYLAGHTAGYDGNFTFDRIGTPYTDNVPIKALRLIPALAGSLLVSVTYQLMLEISAYQWTAILAALLVLFENCFLAQSRFMLLESMQILFGLCGVLCAIKSTRKTGPAAVIWLCIGALSLGCCFSVKYSGLYSYFLAIFLVGRQIWRRFSYAESGLRLVLSALWRVLVLIVLPLSVYVGVFYAHLVMLPKAGPHDSVMTSAFQASLQGGLASITRGQPLHVSHGSQITLRHTHGRTCWLHSHAHVYPVRYTDGRGSSHQQQVTCYSFKDVNNWWIVKRPERASLAVGGPADALRHGEAVQLLHGITSRALNSHDVAAPASPQSQEVSCYIDYNVSMPAQNLWRVEIVNRDSEDATWDSIRSLVRLIHVDSGSALRFSGRQLPSWGFHQHEVVADKVLTHQDTIWNVEEHRYTKAEDRRERERELVSAEMIPTAVTQLTFWEKFAELQYKMIAHAPDAPHGHMFASDPTEWPLLVRSIAYWLSPNSNAQIHLIGNLVTWYAGTISVLTYGIFLALYAIRQRRACTDLPPRAMQQFNDAGCILFLGYWIHYLPYFFMDRTLFLHHYLPAYVFKILLLSYMIDHIYYIIQLREKTQPLTNVFILCVAIWLAYVILTFKKFSVLNYGSTDLTESDLMNLRWKDTWDFILHKKV